MLTIPLDGTSKDYTLNPTTVKPLLRKILRIKGLTVYGSRFFFSLLPSKGNGFVFVGKIGTQSITG